ncbi:hypothetical protein ABND28_22965, partial [Paenibacillus larvae]
VTYRSQVISHSLIPSIYNRLIYSIYLKVITNVVRLIANARMLIKSAAIIVFDGFMYTSPLI